MFDDAFLDFPPGVVNIGTIESLLDIVINADILRNLKVYRFIVLFTLQDLCFKMFQALVDIFVSHSIIRGCSGGQPMSCPPDF